MHLLKLAVAASFLCVALCDNDGNPGATILKGTGYRGVGPKGKKTYGGAKRKMAYGAHNNNKQVVGNQGNAVKGLTDDGNRISGYGVGDQLEQLAAQAQQKGKDKATVSGGAKKEGGISLYNMKAKGERKRVRARGQAENDKEFSLKGENLDANVEANVNRAEQQQGIINIAGTAARNGPYTYNVQCDAENVRNGKCDPNLPHRTLLRDRNGKEYECEVTSTSTKTTECIIDKRRGGRRGVVSTVDDDGVTQISYRGVKVSTSKCTKKRDRRRGSDQPEEYECEVSKGILKADAAELKSSSGQTCETDDRSRRVDISNVKYMREPQTSGGRYDHNLLDCFRMEATLRFQGFSRDELRDVLKRTSLQFHAIINPIGKLACDDTAVCAVKGKTPECYYCDLCKSGARPKIEALNTDGGVLDNAELPCSADGNVDRVFSARVCPPKETTERVCSAFSRSGLSEATAALKAADLTTRLEVYVKSPRARDLEAEFNRIKSNAFLYNAAKTALRLQANFKDLDTSIRDLSDYEIKQLWMQNRREKGELLGCSKFTTKYGIGKGTSGAISLIGLAGSVKQGGITSLGRQLRLGKCGPDSRAPNTNKLKL